VHLAAVRIAGVIERLRSVVGTKISDTALFAPSPVTKAAREYEPSDARVRVKMAPQT
jgi:hypothetical protein